MLQKQKLITNLAGLVFIISIFAVGCKAKDYNEETEATVSSSSDTSLATAETPAVMDTTTMGRKTTMSDSPIMNNSTTASNESMAKPNPAKKGMKGKVMIAEPAKPTGNMEPDNMGVYTNVETQAAFPGGNRGLQNFFDRNIEYPDDATTEGVDGVVNVSFIVDENGKLVSPSVSGQKMGYGLEEEALRVIKKMPNWTAAKLKGKSVKSRYTLPVRFELY